VDVKGGVNCGFRAIAEYMCFIKESHVMVHKTLIREVKYYMNDYMRIYES
jgi:hypothetical protein